jgi:ABC-type multidrug transport system permease subunit
LDVILKVVQSVFFAIIAIILYVDKSQTQTSYLQNFRGVMFFITMNIGFSYVFSSVNLFNFERPIFIRERLSNTYTTSAYFWGRSIAVLPVETFTPFLFLVICYFVVNLDNSGRAFLLAFFSV